MKKVLCTLLVVILVFASVTAGFAITKQNKDQKETATFLEKAVAEIVRVVAENVEEIKFVSTGAQTLPIQKEILINGLGEFSAIRVSTPKNIDITEIEIQQKEKSYKICKEKFTAHETTYGTKEIVIRQNDISKNFNDPEKIEVFAKIKI